MGVGVERVLGGEAAAAAVKEVPLERKPQGQEAAAAPSTAFPHPPQKGRALMGRGMERRLTKQA